MYQPDRLCHPAFSAGKENGYSRIIRYGLHLIKYYPDHEHSDMGASYRLDFGTGITDVTVKQTSIDNPIGFSNSVGTLILSDNLYQKNA